MDIKGNGKLTKLKIIANKNEAEAFSVMFNPESYSESFAVTYDKVPDVNGGLEELRYVKTPPQDFKLKFIIDGTGATNSDSSFFPVFKQSDKSVYEQVNQFLKLTWYPVDGKAIPLEVRWGNFDYHCLLKDVTINYTLFDRGGNPLRAEVDATFIGNTAQNNNVYKKRFGENSTTSTPKSQTTNGLVVSTG